MTEEEVNAKFAEMNQEIFINKLNIDLDKCYNNLVVVFNNVINAFQKDMELRVYEISFDSESILTRDEINERVKIIFDKLKEYIIGELNKNKSLLTNDINNRDLDNYIKNIELYGNELINGIGVLFLKEIELLLKEYNKYFDSYSKARLDKIIKEIVYNHFIERVKTTMESTNSILKNNIENNTMYLENMNKSTVKGR